MDYYSTRFLIWAVALGGLSAVSLPLGSVVGLRTRPRPLIISILSAFGAGALLAALSVELVAPTVFALHDDPGSSHGSDPHRGFYALVAGAVLGGVVYFLLDQLVNAHGGFLRKTATSVAYFDQLRRRRKVQLVEKLSRFALLQDLSPDHIGTLVSMVRPVTYNKDDLVATQGEECRELIFLLEGTMRIVLDGREVGEMGPGEVAGLAPLIMHTPHVGSGIASGGVVALALSAADFERLRELAPEFDQACRDLTAERLDRLKGEVTSRREEHSQWLDRASLAVKTGSDLPSSDQFQQARKAHAGAPLAIWLGILIDGIPESFVIGAGLLVLLQANAEPLDSVTFGAVIPYTLIAGLFLSNFPEALASSANMRLQGWGKRKIFILWFSLMIITAVGAGLGFLLAESLGHNSLVFAEGLAAGAMLTMIASAMIPEAVHMGTANAVGLSTLAGFLAAISFKLLE